MLFIYAVFRGNRITEGVLFKIVTTRMLSFVQVFHGSSRKRKSPCSLILQFCLRVWEGHCHFLHYSGGSHHIDLMWLVAAILVTRPTVQYYASFCRLHGFVLLSCLMTACNCCTNQKDVVVSSSSAD